MHLQFSTEYLFNVLISNISRLSIFKAGTIELIYFLIANYEFEESLIFRAELTQNNSLQQNYEWSFRQQLMFSLLSYSDANLDIGNLILALNCYFPSFINFPKNKLGKNFIKIISNFF